jgi:hypothetical protein
VHLNGDVEATDCELRCCAASVRLEGQIADAHGGTRSSLAAASWRSTSTTFRSGTRHRPRTLIPNPLVAQRRIDDPVMGAPASVSRFAASVMLIVWVFIVA